MHRARRNFQDYIDGNNSKNTLLALLQLRRGLGASNARDMIYAHLGIAVDSLVGQPALKVDYRKSYQNFSQISLSTLSSTILIIGFLPTSKNIVWSKAVPTYLHGCQTGLRKSWTDNVPDINIPDPWFSRPRISPSPSSTWSSDGKRQLNCKGTILARIKIVGSKVLRFPHFTREEIKQARSKSWPISGSSSDLNVEKMTIL